MHFKGTADRRTITFAQNNVLRRLKKKTIVKQPKSIFDFFQTAIIALLI